MPRCSATKGDNSPCERIVGASQEYRYAHDPDRSGERHRAAQKAGRAKSNGELRGVKSQLQNVADKVLKGEIDTRRATAATQALQGLIRAIEAERRVRELTEVEEALSELEAKAAQRKPPRWPA